MDNLQLTQVPMTRTGMLIRKPRALKSGFEMHLAKPIDPAELIAAVKALARRRTLRPA